MYLQSVKAWGESDAAAVVVVGETNFLEVLVKIVPGLFFIYPYLCNVTSTGVGNTNYNNSNNNNNNNKQSFFSHNPSSSSPFFEQGRERQLRVLRWRHFNTLNRVFQTLARTFVYDADLQCVPLILACLSCQLKK